MLLSCACTCACGARPQAPEPDPFVAQPEPSASPGLPLPEREVVRWPLENVHITSPYGFRVDPVTGKGTRLHRGLDLRAREGELVSTIAAGRVAFAGHDPLLGNAVIVDHGQGIESFYGHLEDVLVLAGAELEPGAALGISGNSGRSQAPHLHLAIEVDGVAVDPLLVLGRPLTRPDALVFGGEEIADTDTD